MDFKVLDTPQESEDPNLKQDSLEDFVAIDVTDVVDKTQTMDFDKWVNLIGLIHSNRKILTDKNVKRTLLKSTVKDGVPTIL